MKLFVTDYDETLYISDEEIRENIKKIKKLQENDFLFVIATGRSFPSIKNQTKLFNIPYDYLITSDGSIIYDKDDNIVKMFDIDKDSVTLMKNFYGKLNYEEIQFSYKEGYQNIYDEENTLLGINICMSNRIYNEKLEKNFLKLKRKYPKYNFLAYRHTNYSYLCIKPRNVNKSYAINYLKDLYDIKKKEVYVIGDSSNDIEMIHDFKGAAMSSSYPDVLKITKKRFKKVSDYIDSII